MNFPCYEFFLADVDSRALDHAAVKAFHEKIVTASEVMLRCVYRREAGAIVHVEYSTLRRRHRRGWPPIANVGVPSSPKFAIRLNYRLIVAECSRQLQRPPRLLAHNRWAQVSQSKVLYYTWTIASA
ncbi:hypothetical protein Y032_0049g1779 [Ancylostoma ceylanicum]|uniref:Uncharacterized protein n=1 Tax=Ancylostoma ceylanicum TaxID=53326 RepID=A0A016UAC1_9BILA|nr:hypothetical protein Y032_0049g1779 [Ancylostoma ceylanicum]